MKVLFKLFPLLLILFSCNQGNPKKNTNPYTVIISQKDTLSFKKFDFTVVPNSDSIKFVLYYIGTGKPNAHKIVENYELVMSNGIKGYMLYNIIPNKKAFENGFAHIFTTNSEYFVPFSYKVDFSDSLKYNNTIQKE